MCKVERIHGMSLRKIMSKRVVLMTGGIDTAARVDSKFPLLSATSAPSAFSAAVLVLHSPRWAKCKSRRRPLITLNLRRSYYK